MWLLHTPNSNDAILNYISDFDFTGSLTGMPKSMTLRFSDMAVAIAVIESHIDSSIQRENYNMEQRDSSGLRVERFATSATIATSVDVSPSGSTANWSPYPADLKIFTGDIAAALAFARSNKENSDVLIEIFGNYLYMEQL